AVAKSRAEAASTAKSRLLTAVAEDLSKTLLTMAGSGAATGRDRLDPTERDRIASMRLSARAMLAQLDEVRDCLDIEDGRSAPEARSLALYRLAPGVAAALRPAAAGRGVMLALRIAPALPCQLHGWVRQLRQITLGLVAHAVQQASPGRLRLTLEAAE